MRSLKLKWWIPPVSGRISFALAIEGDMPLEDMEKAAGTCSSLFGVQARSELHEVHARFARDAK